MSDGRHRVLVVDDDAGCRELVVLVLDGAGHEVRSAADGREALATLDEWRPDLIVLDLSMPHLDGQAFAEQRHEELADIPVLLLSGATDVQAQADALGAEALLKPFELDELVGTVGRLASR